MPVIQENENFSNLEIKLSYNKRNTARFIKNLDEQQQQVEPEKSTNDHIKDSLRIEESKDKMKVTSEINNSSIQLIEGDIKDAHSSIDENFVKINVTGIECPKCFEKQNSFCSLF